MSSAINGVQADIKTIATSIFSLLSLVGGIAFVVMLVMEMLDYHNGKPVDSKRLVLAMIALVICAGGATLAFTIGGAAS